MYLLIYLLNYSIFTYVFMKLFLGLGFRGSCSIRDFFLPAALRRRSYVYIYIYIYIYAYIHICIYILIVVIILLIVLILIYIYMSFFRRRDTRRTGSERGDPAKGNLQSCLSRFCLSHSRAACFSGFPFLDPP